MLLPRKVVANTVIQIVGRFLTLLISLVTLSYIATHLTVNGSVLEGYGQYAIVLTYISIIGATADLGLFTLVVREITGKQPDEAGRIVGSALAFRFLLMVAALLILAALFRLLPYALVVKQGILLGVVIAFFMLLSQTVAAIFQANLISERLVIAEIIGRLTIAFLTIYFLHRGFGLLPVIAANLIGNAVLLAVSYILSRRMAPIKLSFDFLLWKRVGPEFWSIAVVTVLGLVHFRLDSLILSVYKPVSDVGVYGMAYRIFDIILVIPAIFAANLLPALTRLNADNRADQIGQLVERSIGLLFAISSVIGVVVLALAPWLIVFITSRDFLAAAVPLRLLVPAFIFLFMTTLCVESIIAVRQQKRLIGGYVLVVLLDIVLNLILVPRYSYIGAASSTVASEAALMVYSFFLLTKILPVRLRQIRLVNMAIFTVAVGLIGLLIHRFMTVPLGQFERLSKFGQGGWLFLASGVIVVLAGALFGIIFRPAVGVKMRPLTDDR